MRSFEECATATLHLLSVPRICERPATKITLLHAQVSSASFPRSRAPLMWQNTHLSLRPIQTFYLCQSMTGTCLIKISDVLTLCRSNFKILSGALYAYTNYTTKDLWNSPGIYAVVTGHHNDNVWKEVWPENAPKMEWHTKHSLQFIEYSCSGDIWVQNRYFSLHTSMSLYKLSSTGGSWSHVNGSL